MVDHLSIGVLGIQGAISEHVLMMKQVMNKRGQNSKVSIIRRKREIDEVSGLIIPGGESTTISRFILRNDLYDAIRIRAREKSLSVMGTCAGCVLVSSEIVEENKDIKLLSLMDIKVKRNAFGRQRESFEQMISIEGISDAFPAVFIRAPIIQRIWGNCKALALIDEGILMAKQNNILALSFHPELTCDTTIHEYFYDMVCSSQ